MPVFKAESSVLAEREWVGLFVKCKRNKVADEFASGYNFRRTERKSFKTLSVISDLFVSNLVNKKKWIECEFNGILRYVEIVFPESESSRQRIILIDEGGEILWVRSAENLVDVSNKLFEMIVDIEPAFLHDSCRFICCEKAERILLEAEGEASIIFDRAL